MHRLCTGKLDDLRATSAQAQGITMDQQSQHQVVWAEASVRHPLLDIPIAIDGRPLELNPEQYIALVDELCSLIFCTPHLAPRICDLARSLDLPEVPQFWSW